MRYDNVCKFANDYETQRDRYRAVAEKLAEALKKLKEMRIILDSSALAEYEAMKK